MDQANTKIDSFATKASGAFRALQGAAVFGAVAAGIRSIVEAADGIDGISAKIGDTAENVQRLQAVASAFDAEIGALTTGIQTLQQKLGEGKIDKALADLGINVANFKALAPTEMYLAVAEALGAIEDPAERAAAAAEVLGKGGKALSGTFRENIRDADQWIKMSGDTVAAMDTLGIAYRNAKSSLVAFGSEVLANMTLLRGYQRVVELFGKNDPIAVGGRGTGTPHSPLALPPGLPADYEAVNKSLGVAVEHSIKQQKEAEKIAKHEQDITESLRASVTYFAPLVKGYQTIAVSVEDTSADVADVRESMEAMAGISFTETWAPFVQGAKDAGDLTDEVRRKMARLASWKDIGATLSNAIMGAIQGGGDVGKALGGAAGQMLGTKLGTSIGDWAGKSIGGAMGSAIGGAAGSILPVVGTILGSVGGSLIGKLFGGGEGKKVNDLRDQFVSASGGIHELNLKAQAAGLTLDSLLNAKKVSDFEAAVLKLNAAFAEEEAMTQRGIAAMEKYGITIEQAGAKFKQTQMNATAEDLVKDFQGLVAVGVDMDTIIEKMGGSVGEFVHRSIEMGTSVPREMQGIIAKMIESGTLLDKNGEKFTDISQIPFADSLNDGMSKLIAKLDQMLDRIGVQLPNALSKVPRNVDIDITERRRRVWDGGDGDYTPMATGGIVRRPTFALVGEAGPEAVIPLSKLGAMGGGGGETHIHLHNPTFDGYASAQQAARQILGALTGERERRGQSLAFAGA